MEEVLGTFTQNLCFSLGRVAVLGKKRKKEKKKKRKISLYGIRIGEGQPLRVTSNVGWLRSHECPLLRNADNVFAPQLFVISTELLSLIIASLLVRN